MNASSSSNNSSSGNASRATSFASAKWTQLIEELNNVQTELSISLSHYQSLIEPILQTLQQSDSEAIQAQSPPQQHDSMTRRSVEQLSNTLKSFIQTKQILSNQHACLTSSQRHFGTLPFMDLIRIAERQHPPLKCYKDFPEWKAFEGILQDLAIDFSDSLDVTEEHQEEQDLIITRQAESYICPISLTTFINPHKNVACGHTYSLEAIKMLANKNTVIKCPVVGCPSTVRIKQLVPDDLLIRKLKRKQQLNESQSQGY